MLEDEWMSDHAERLLRMLPGGIHVVGIAWFSDKKTFSDRKSHIHKTLGRIQKMNNQITTANVDDSISDNMVGISKLEKFAMYILFFWENNYCKN